LWEKFEGKIKGNIKLTGFELNKTNVLKSYCNWHLTNKALQKYIKSNKKSLSEWCARVSKSFFTFSLKITGGALLICVAVISNQSHKRDLYRSKQQLIQ